MAQAKRDAAESNHMGDAHHIERSVFGSMLVLGSPSSLNILSGEPLDASLKWYFVVQIKLTRFGEFQDRWYWCDHFLRGFDHFPDGRRYDATFGEFARDETPNNWLACLGSEFSGSLGLQFIVYFGSDLRSDSSLEIR